MSHSGSPFFDLAEVVLRDPLQRVDMLSCSSLPVLRGQKQRRRYHHFRAHEYQLRILFQLVDLFLIGQNRVSTRRQGIDRNIISLKFQRQTLSQTF